MRRRRFPRTPARCAGALGLVILLATLSACDHGGKTHALQPKRNKSDLNRDGFVNELDLQLYAE